ncbi:MAG: methyltransferase domain-containing protein [Planctomycetota bacterium]
MTQALWTPRGVKETQDLYADWAETYDADVQAAGYVTPGRIATALATFAVDKSSPVLDFGCGTGLSGEALTQCGFSVIDGSDLTPEMLEQARARNVYRTLERADPDAPIDAAGYSAVTATGVVSLGAAPPETLAQLVGAMDAGSLLAFSYNDATLAYADYISALDNLRPEVDMLFEEYGPHLPGKDMGSTVYVLRKPG